MQSIVRIFEETRLGQKLYAVFTPLIAPYAGLKQERVHISGHETSPLSLHTACPSLYYHMKPLKNSMARPAAAGIKHCRSWFFREDVTLVTASITGCKKPSELDNCLELL